jgi:catechol 2,3-dioxygenase-like lactoylglutathione lyase family enzyme
MKMRWIGILALAALCACVPCTFAQAGQITGIAHIAYRVSDLDRELAFLQKLGYQQSFALTANGKTTEVFVKINDRQFLELYPRTDPSQPLGWMHVCYESGDINALVAALAARGLNPRPVSKAGAGNLISALRDPDGRTTEFTQYMPGSRHTLDKGMHLGENRISATLLGFILPVSGLDADRQFYKNLGFNVADAKAGFRVTDPAVADLRIDIDAAGAGDQPQTLFQAPDARKAANDLRKRGIDGSRQKKTVVVHDPDGNTLVLVEAGAR